MKVVCKFTNIWEKKTQILKVGQLLVWRRMEISWPFSSENAVFLSASYIRHSHSNLNHRISDVCVRRVLSVSIQFRCMNLFFKVVCFLLENFVTVEIHHELTWNNNSSISVVLFWLNFISHAHFTKNTIPWQFSTKYCSQGFIDFHVVYLCTIRTTSEMSWIYVSRTRGRQTLEICELISITRVQQERSAISHGKNERDLILRINSFH